MIFTFQKETPKPYQFAYEIKDEFGNENHRQESGNEQGAVQGNYGYTDAYGLFRQVEYTADDYGFKARIKTNEPGTDNQNPADVEVYADPVQTKYEAPNKVGPVIVAAKPAGSYAAPALVYGGPSVVHRSGYLAPARLQGVRRAPFQRPRYQGLGYQGSGYQGSGYQGSGYQGPSYRGPVYAAPHGPVHAPAYAPGAYRGVAVTTTHQRGHDDNKHYGHASKVVSHQPY